MSLQPSSLFSRLLFYPLIAAALSGCQDEPVIAYQVTFETPPAVVIPDRPATIALEVAAHGQPEVDAQIAGKLEQHHWRAPCSVPPVEIVVAGSVGGPPDAGPADAVEPTIPDRTDVEFKSGAAANKAAQGAHRGLQLRRRRI